MNGLQILPVPDMPEIREGDDLANITLDALSRSQGAPMEGDIFVFTQKIVSKAEGRIIPLASIDPSPLASQFATRWNRDARHIEAVLQQAKRVVKMERGVLIVETSHGLVCAHAGVDASNLEDPDTVSLLPEDPDASAERLREAMERQTGSKLGVIVSDTFGRPWREGQTNIAIGVSGTQAMIDYRGQTDPQARTLGATQIAIADEIAAATELVMGKLNRIPVALVRGVSLGARDGKGMDLVRPEERDLFR